MGRVRRVACAAQAGADVDQADEDSGETPLSIASKRGHEALTRLLVKHGAGVDKADNIGITPLQAAERRGYHRIASAIRDTVIEERESRVKAAKQTLEEQVQTLTARLERSEHDNTGLRSQLQQVTEQLSSAQKRIRELTEELDEAERQAQHAEEQARQTAAEVTGDAIGSEAVAGNDRAPRE